jgi:phytoene/squalene synthetase
MLLDLIQNDNERDSGLRAYIRHMMAVITFDARRRQQLISQQELDEYTTHLAIAVTEVLHHYIGHDQSAPHDATRYLAVAGAHIAHMLRDTYEDIAAGYYNIPCEVLDAYGIAPWDVTSPAYRDWVKSRVQLAREYFRAGRGYLVQVESVRARVAGYAYVVRFEGVLDAIERDDYQLQPRQGAGKSLLAGLRMGWSVFTRMLRDQLTHSHRLSPAGVQEPSPF